MNKKTLRALKMSIQKWQGVCHGKADHGIQDCALCQIFLNEHECNGCPVMERTGRGSCLGTPYMDWFNHFRWDHGIEWSNNGLKKFKGCSKCKTIARKELDFLKSLLPEGEKA